ncbi:unnamed protein product, partial [Discosporangium mesarthrocarpum]
MITATPHTIWHFTQREGYQGDANKDPYDLTQSSEALCGPGSWCEGGRRFPCYEGFYGNEFGLTSGNCSGTCAPGFLCPNGSVSAAEIPCGALAPPGFFADEGLLFSCAPGRYGATPGLSTPRCSGECQQGFFCPSGSVSQRERVCGGADLICPAGSGAPQRVSSGFYTSSFNTFPKEETCPPGYFRNTSGEHSIDPSRGNGSAVVTQVPLPPCELCPEGTFKGRSGDDLGLCRQCDKATAEGTEGRTSCVCRRVPGGAVDTMALYFNATLGQCQNVTAGFSPPADTSLVDSPLARYRQMECEPGFSCLEGIRTPCPAGWYGPH